MGKFLVKKAKTGYVFNLKAGNGEVIAVSEVYTTLANCKKGIASVEKNAPIAPIENQTEKDFKPVTNPKFEIYQDKKGEYRFRLKATNGQIIATGEGYTTLSACQNGVASIKKNAVDAKLEIEE